MESKTYEQITAEMLARLDELRPLHEEYLRLEAAAHSMGLTAKAAPRDVRERPVTPRQPRRGGHARRAKRGHVADLIWRDVAEHPGTTVAETAKRLGKSAPQIHGVIGRMGDKVRREDGKVYPAGFPA